MDLMLYAIVRDAHWNPLHDWPWVKFQMSHRIDCRKRVRPFGTSTNASHALSKNPFDLVPEKVAWNEWQGPCFGERNLGSLVFKSSQIEVGTFVCHTMALYGSTPDPGQQLSRVGCDAYTKSRWLWILISNNFAAQSTMRWDSLGSCSTRLWKNPKDGNDFSNELVVPWSRAMMCCGMLSILHPKIVSWSLV